MQLSNHFIISASQRDVWDFFIDIPRMSVCLPGLRETVQVDAQSYTMAVETHVGAVQSTFHGTVTKTTEEAPHHLTTTIHLWDAKTASIITGQIETCFSIEAPSSTRVDYAIDMVLRGRLTQVDEGLVEGALLLFLETFLQCARMRIERPPAAAPAAARSRWQRLVQVVQNLVEKLKQTR